MSSLLGDIFKHEKVPISYISELLSYCIATRFLHNKKDRIDIDDVATLIHDINRPKEIYHEPNSSKTYTIQIELHHFLRHRYECHNGDDQIMKLFNSCILYVNEDLEIKRLLSVWMSADNGNFIIEQKRKSLAMVVSIDGRLPYQKIYQITYDKKVNHGITIGKKDIDNDYGLYKQYQFLMDVFKFDILNENIIDNYKKIADNGKNPSYLSMFEATKYLYECMSLELNKTISADNEMLNNISGGIKKIIIGESGHSNEILKFDSDYQIEKIDYNKLKQYLNDMSIYTVVKGTKSPILAIMSKKENKELFRIRTRKEKYKNSKTGNRYKVYFESSNSFLDNVLTRL